ncbi:STE like transcription factor-domain-containing protein [Stachybotrys elegans]|uniref:STE like transcription factor-domain-containing protein n=1 Tax=Stachybotrys elegans TaxID=80388 RepID=A0A8K0T303_9HYPO|nr:STE like transcription factor-domain-containing protein [Stachybotrys elegans]
MAPQKPETFMLSTEAQQALPHDAQVALQQVDNLKYFLISAPVDWQADQYIRRFLLPTGEYVSCVLWNNLFHISGTDIVRCLSFRFQAFGRPVKNSKKFEEGIFSDLRNLKSGTDASLEEPKSAFLDFLYKNNCIRTQKKQKVFYWYSVPHDRLFLDALERDLKREKMGQEATTVAVSEPALSFQYDSSQSLYEQLTKAQQANSSSFNAQQPSFSQSQSTSPVMRAMDSMPPPSMIPQSMPPLAEGMDAMVSYQTMAMAPAVTQQMPPVKRDLDFTRVQYNQNGVPVNHGHQRHASMPAYALEYSPAPSFVSSQYEDYSNRGISFEPITPPQQALGMSGEPAYIANEETGLYSAIPDHLSGMNGLNGMVQLPPTNMAGSQFARPYGSNVYSVIEGSPTYKQRRRRSSIPPSMSAIAAATASATSVSRPSDLRRSVSASVGPVAEGDESADNSPPGLAYSNTSMPMGSQHQKDMVDMSRHGTPLDTIEDSPALHGIGLQHDYSPVGDDGESSIHDPRRAVVGPNGIVRRARSATAMELGPYPQKSHSCPIPTCGRLFKRLEHLKRHVRTHTQEKPYICPHCSKAFSRSDNLAQYDPYISFMSFLCRNCQLAQRARNGNTPAKHQSFGDPSSITFINDSLIRSVIRHKRTHSREDGGEGALNLSGEEEEDFSGEDHLGSLEESSPSSEHAYITGSLNSMVGDHSSHGVPVTMASQGYNSLQTLSMPMTISQPTAINATGMITFFFAGLLA